MANLTDELRAIAVKIPQGGIAVIKCPRPISLEMAKRIRRAWDDLIANTSPHRCIVLEDGIDLSFVRPDDAALNAAYSAIFGDAA